MHYDPYPMHHMYHMYPIHPIHRMYHAPRALTRLDSEPSPNTPHLAHDTSLPLHAACPTSCFTNQSTLFGTFIMNGEVTPLSATQYICCHVEGTVHWCPSSLIPL